MLFRSRAGQTAVVMGAGCIGLVTMMEKQLGLYDDANQMLRDYYDKLNCEQKEFIESNFGIFFD